MVQLDWFLGRLFGLLIKTGLPLIGNEPKPLANRILVPLGLTATASPTTAAIQEKIFGFGMNTLKIWNEEMDDINLLKNLIYW